MNTKPTYKELEQRIAELENQRKVECASLDKKYQKIINQQKEEIQMAHELNNASFENPNIGVCFVDLKGNFIRVNNEMSKLFGYTKEELEALNINDITIEEDKKRTHKHINEAINSKENSKATFSKRYYHKKGHIVYCNVSTVLLNSFKGENQYFISLSQDVSRLREHSDLLAKERAQLLELLDDIPEPIYVVDYEDFTILYANKEKKKLFGEEILGKKCYSVFHGLDTVCSFCNREAIKENEGKTVRSEHYFPSISKRFYNVDKLITWHNGRKAKFQISFNISELKAAEIEIRKLSAAVEQSPSTIVITDLLGNIEYANPYFSELTGYSIEEARGKNARILKSKKTNPEIFSDLWKTITNGKIWKGEFINLKKNRQEYIEYATIAPIFDENHKIINYIAIKEDITEKKKYEIALRESEKKLRELNATKDKFFSIIAHDLKNPFNAILGFSELLVENIQQYDKQKILKFISVIKISTEQASNLLENLLVWARAQSGRIEFNPKVNNINKIVNDCIELTERQANNKNITLQLQAKGENISFCDENMINTVVRNLLTNAIKFSYNNTTIEIFIESIDNKCSVSVKDTGIGIATQDIDKLFKIESKVSTSGTANETGTGLGLLLCKEFVEKNNGTIWVESELTKGSTFKFSLPCF